jgi:hypothetical protein
MKYINHKDLGLIVFEPRHTHRAMVSRLGLSPEDVSSAGFVGARDRFGVFCHGESLGLKHKADKGDTFQLQAWLKATAPAPAPTEG